MCDYTRAAVSGLEIEMQGRATVRTVPHLDPEAKDAVRINDWRSHGALAFLDGRRIYIAGDHAVNVKDIHDNILDALDLPPMCVEAATLDAALVRARINRAI